jgi:adenine-specific DNA glycosylase
VAHIRHASQGLLLIQNPPQGLFGGLWGLPIYPRDAKRSCPAGTRGLTQALASELGLDVRLGPRSAEFEHVLTHRRLLVSVYPGRLPSGDFTGFVAQSARWIQRPEQLARLGVARQTRREAVTDPLA